MPVEFPRRIGTENFIDCSPDDLFARHPIEPQSRGIDLVVSELSVFTSRKHRVTLRRVNVESLDVFQIGRALFDAALERLIEFPEFLMRLMGLGDIKPFDENARDGIAFVADRFIDEIEVAKFRPATFLPQQGGGSLMSDVPLAGRVYLIQQFEKTLTFKLRDNFPDRFANEIALSEQTDIRLVDEFERVLRACQDCDEPRRALKLTSLKFIGFRLTPLRHDTRRGLYAYAEQPFDSTVFAPRRRVSELEMRLFDLATSIKAEREILDRNRLAGKHTGEERFKHFACFAPHLHTRPSQRVGVLMAQNRFEGVVVEPCPLRPPADEHRLFRSEEEIHQGLESLRPVLRRAERR